MKPEELTKSIIDMCPFGILVVDMIGTILVTNRETERMFGYGPSELAGKTVDILVPTRLRAQHARHRSRFSINPDTRIAKNRELVGRRKDGGEFPVEIGLSPARDGSRTISVIVDIGDRARLERLKSEFVATVRHELRTPLTSIAGALGLLVGNAGEALPASSLRLLAIAHKNSQSLIQLVDGILTFEKLESGQVLFAQKRTEVRTLVAQAIEVNRIAADACGVRLRLDQESTTGEIRADPDWLVRAVSNLLSNAIKFSPPDEEVVVDVKKRDGLIRITVRDHGTGVPDDFRSYIFNAFEQADASDARRRGGAGLGRSIVKQIVTRLGGQVDFENARDGGAIFHVDLPDYDQTVATASGLDADSHPQFSQ